MSFAVIAFLSRSRSARKAFLALSVGLGMAALFLFSGAGPLGPAPAAHAALSPPDARPTAPAAELGKGPFPNDDAMHCHHGKDFDPPRSSAGGHIHNDFHSGFGKNTSYATKYAGYFTEYEEVSWSDNTAKAISTFVHGWKPPDQPDWHNHGDDDTHWWTPDADKNCLFSPEFPQDTYEFTISEDADVGDPVGDYPVQAHDEDGDEPVHTLEGADRTSFSIDPVNGQIMVKAPLDYETKNEYSVTVRARDDSGGYDTAAVTITVINVEEPGVVTLLPAQPRVGVALTARLTDPDRDVTVETWKWRLSNTGTAGTYTNIHGEESDSYTPATGDEGKYLKAVVTYSDGHGASKTAESPANAVRAAPHFSSTTDTRDVDENTGSGQNIGDPVEAANHQSGFTYTLGGTDRASFAIDSTTGQLKTKAALNFESKNSYTVTVTATDAARESARVTVTINVTNVDEDGVVTLSSQQPRVDAALTASLTDPDGSVSSVTWQWASANSSTPPSWDDISGATSARYTPKADDVGKYLQATASYNDGFNTAAKTSARGVTAYAVKQPNRAPAFPDQDTNTPGEQTEQTREVEENTSANQNIGDPVAATDPDNDSLTYTLGGTDGRSFNIVAESGQLQTKAALDHETKDTYTVTVTAADSSRATGSVTVTINVTDVDEPGVVALSPQHPRVGEDLTAALVDLDGVVSGVTWSWHRSRDKSSWNAIGGATSASYTPVAADVDNYLRATASYTDTHGSKTVRAVSDNAVQAAAANNPPVFRSNAAVTESIPENTPANQDFGNSVRATDQDTGDTLTYTLVGTDRAYFAIGSTTGRLRTRAVLDFENPRDAGADNEYQVTVRVFDGVNTVTKGVTITVTDVEENGSVRLSPQQPRVGTRMTATLTDPDGGISGLSWQWHKSSNGQANWTRITTGITSNGTSTNYTTVAADVGKYLRATASYTDRRGPNKSASKVSVNAVRAATANRPPVFRSNAAATESIPENTPAGRDIGNPVAASDADRDGLKYTLVGSDARYFRIDSGSGQLRTGAVLDYENPRDADRNSVYQVTVRVSDGVDTVTKGVTITVTNADDRGVVTLSSPRPRVGEVLTAGLADPDGVVGVVTWRWERSSNRSSWNVISGATLVAYTPVAGDVDKYLRATASYNDSHRSGKSARAVSDTTVRAAAGNNPPIFNEGTSAARSIAENAAANTNVGNPVRATDQDTGDTLTYTLGGTDRAYFAIGSTTGQLRTGAVLDFENPRDAGANNVYDVTVRVSDGVDTVTKGVTITVTDVEEDGSVRLSSQQPRVGTRLTATLTDPDGQVSDVSWQWAKATSATGPFNNISAATDRSYTPVADDVGNYLRATASYTDRRGPNKSANAVAASAVRAATINNPPVFGSNAAATESIAENTPANQDFGNPVTATDRDTGDTLTYALGGTDSAYFAIGSTTGRLRTGTVLDYEDPRDAGANNVYEVTVRVSDGVDTATKEVTITVTDVDEPGAVTLSSSHPRVGQELTATLRDPDGTTSGVTWQWHSSANRSTWAEISGETSASYTPVAADVGKYLRATASYSDSHGSKTVPAVSVNAVQTATANRPPVFSGGTSATRSIAENTPAGQNIGDPVRATDRDTGDTLIYALGGTDAASFGIVASSGQLRTRATLDYERKRSYSVRVTATDRARASNTIAVTINVTDVNEPPTFNEGNSAARGIAENTAANANIGSPIAATDPEGDSLTYTLGGADAASFAIVASTGQLKTKAPLNRATRASHTVTVSVRDSRNSNGSPDRAADDTITVTINVTDVNEPPTFDDGTSTPRSIAENAQANTNIGSPVAATDPDGDTRTYSLVGSHAGSFHIGPTTGQLKTKAALNYESKSRYTVTVIATDTASARDTTTVTINVTDVEEKGSVTLSHQQPRVGTRLTATLTDPDGQVSGVSWQWQRAGARAGPYAPIQGATTSSYTPVAADAGKYLRATVAYSDRRGPGKSAKSEPVNPVSPVTPVARPRANTAPVFAANTATRSIAENTPANRKIGPPVRATDRDTGDRLTYALSGTDAASFGIVASSGQLRTKAALDYERKHSYSVTVTVTDTARASDTIAVTINVTNIDIPGKPGTPTVTAASASGHSALWVRWTAPGAAAVIDGYNVQYRAGTSGNWHSSRNASGTSATVSGLVSDTTYQVRVRAYNSEGRSGWSNPGQGRTDAAPAQQQRTPRQPTRTPAVCTPAIGFRTGVPWSFTAARGGEDPPDVFLEVWNRDLCAMDFRVSSSARWLSISPASGRSEGAHQEKQIRISADISGLDVGTHTAAVRITAPRSGNSPQSVSVSLTITRPAPPESNYCQERTVIESSDSAFRVVVPANSAPCDTGITVESLDADSQQTPVGEGVKVVEKVVRAGQVSAASADTRINAALWALLPGDRVSACEEAAAAAVYRVVDGDSWDLLTHRCEMDEQGRVWLVLPLTGFGVYAVTLPAPSVESGTTGEVQGEVQGEVRLQTPEAAEADTSPSTPSPETMASNGPASSINAVESQPTPTPKPEVVQVELQPTLAPGPDVVHADVSPAGLWADLPPEELALPVVETGQSPPRRLGSLGILLYILAPIILIIALLLIMFGVRNLRGAESATP